MPDQRTAGAATQGISNSWNNSGNNSWNNSGIITLVLYSHDSCNNSGNNSSNILVHINRRIRQANTISIENKISQEIVTSLHFFQITVYT